ncbi:MAG: PH domain-containing protein [Parcubacteria group bacterium]|jgi:uncharacterized membrane protein YdbT with pleckstrin-like domain|nr:PH domain-containing protein [Parcubacteria group bacterium]
MKAIISLFTKSGNHFEGKEDGEEVILLLRRHPFFIILRLIFFVFLVLLPLVAGLVFSRFLCAHDLFVLYWFVLSSWYLLIWSGIFYTLTVYTLDVWIVTNRRIIDNKQHGFFNRTVSELHLARVQDVSVETKGLIQTFFKFGDVQIQTAGANEKFKFMQVPYPEKVKDEIMKVVREKNF